MSTPVQVKKIAKRPLAITNGMFSLRGVLLVGCSALSQSRRKGCACSPALLPGLDCLFAHTNFQIGSTAMQLKIKQQLQTVSAGQKGYVGPLQLLSRLGLTGMYHGTGTNHIVCSMKDSEVLW